MNIPEYTNEQIEYILSRAKVPFQRVKDISKEVAQLVSQGKIIGWFQGRMEHAQSFQTPGIKL